jgi:hypothetical protein
MRVAFATCSAMPDGFEEDRPAALALGAEFLSWDDPAADWASFDRVVIRSTWDYTRRADEFLAWCSRVGAERLRNPPDLVSFNVDKRYLTDLAVPTVPTQLVGPTDPPPALDGEVVVKPNVSAGARDTGRFGPMTHDQAIALIERIKASGRSALVQPYISSVDERGEVAIVFLAGRRSHVLRKRAVLEPDEVAPMIAGELGVARAMLREDLVAASKCTAAEISFAEAVLEEVSARFAVPLYARVDLITSSDGPLLLELEAVEPRLFLSLASGAHERFAAAVLAS